MGTRVDEAIDALRQAIADEAALKEDGSASEALEAETARVLGEMDYIICGPDSTTFCLYASSDEFDLRSPVKRTIDVEAMLADEIEHEDNDQLRHLLACLERMADAVRRKLQA